MPKGKSSSLSLTDKRHPLAQIAGHNNVCVLNGGLSAWEKAGGKIEQEARQYEPSKFKCRLRPNMFASKEEIKTAMEDGGVCTVTFKASFNSIQIPAKPTCVKPSANWPLAIFYNMTTPNDYRQVTLACSMVSEQSKLTAPRDYFQINKELKKL